MNPNLGDLGKETFRIKFHPPVPRCCVRTCVQETPLLRSDAKPVHAETVFDGNRIDAAAFFSLASIQIHTETGSRIQIPCFSPQRARSILLFRLFYRALLFETKSPHYRMFPILQQQRTAHMFGPYSLGASHNDIFLRARSCFSVNLDSRHHCTKTVFVFQGIPRAKSVLGAAIAEPWPCYTLQGLGSSGSATWQGISGSASAYRVERATRCRGQRRPIGANDLARRRDGSVTCTDPVITRQRHDTRSTHRLSSRRAANSDRDCLGRIRRNLADSRPPRGEGVSRLPVPCALRLRAPYRLRVPVRCTCRSFRTLWARKSRFTWTTTFRNGLQQEMQS
jgi:hypothetical protein